MTYEQARAKATELIQAQGSETRTVSQYRVICTTGDSTNLSRGWEVEARPIGHHLDAHIVTD